MMRIVGTPAGLGRVPTCKPLMNPNLNLHLHAKPFRGHSTTPSSVEEGECAWILVRPALLPCVESWSRRHHPESPDNNGTHHICILSSHHHFLRHGMVVCRIRNTEPRTLVVSPLLGEAVTLPYPPSPDGRDSAWANRAPCPRRAAGRVRDSSAALALLGLGSEIWLEADVGVGQGRTERPASLSAAHHTPPFLFAGFLHVQTLQSHQGQPQRGKAEKKKYHAVASDSQQPPSLFCLSLPAAERQTALQLGLERKNLGRMHWMIFLWPAWPDRKRGVPHPSLHACMQPTDVAPPLSSLLLSLLSPRMARCPMLLRGSAWLCRSSPIQTRDGNMLGKMEGVDPHPLPPPPIRVRLHRIWPRRQARAGEKKPRRGFRLLVSPWGLAWRDDDAAGFVTTRGPPYFSGGIGASVLNFAIFALSSRNNAMESIPHIWTWTESGGTYMRVGHTATADQFRMSLTGWSCSPRRDGKACGIVAVSGWHETGRRNAEGCLRQRSAFVHPGAQHLQDHPNLRPATILGQRWSTVTFPAPIKRRPVARCPSTSVLRRWLARAEPVLQVKPSGGVTAAVRDLQPTQKNRDSRDHHQPLPDILVPQFPRSRVALPHASPTVGRRQKVRAKKKKTHESHTGWSRHNMTLDPPQKQPTSFGDPVTTHRPQPS